MQKLDAVLIRSNNNFGLVRLLTAFLVVYAHSLELFKETDSLYVGGLRIHIFFFLSGLLITASFFHSKTYSSYIIMRLFRLWPAMIVCTLLTVLLLGPLVTTLSSEQYFSHPVTLNYLFNNLLVYNTQFHLPGVFTHNHYPEVVNGSIWTLKLELQCYVFIFLTGVT
ncbi:MAG: acyltransferase, partial [Sphingobacteriaceae bacterium]